MSEEVQDFTSRVMRLSGTVLEMAQQKIKDDAETIENLKEENKMLRSLLSASYRTIEAGNDYQLLVKVRKVLHYD